MSYTCPICGNRILNPLSRRILLIGESFVHKLCLTDFKLRTGGAWQTRKTIEEEENDCA